MASYIRPSMLNYLSGGSSGTGIGAGISEGLRNGLAAAIAWQNAQQDKKQQDNDLDPNNPLNQINKTKAEQAAFELKQEENPGTPQTVDGGEFDPRLKGIALTPQEAMKLLPMKPPGSQVDLHVFSPTVKPGTMVDAKDVIPLIRGGEEDAAKRNGPMGMQQRGLSMMLKEAISPTERTRIDTLSSAISLRNNLADTWQKFQDATKDMPYLERQALGAAAASGTLGPTAQHLGGVAGQLAAQYGNLQQQFARESRKLATGSSSSVPDTDLQSAISAYTPSLADTPEKAASQLNAFNDTLLRPTIQGVMQNLKAFQKPTGEWTDPALGTVYGNYSQYLNQLPGTIAATPTGFDKLPTGNFDVPVMGGETINPILPNQSDVNGGKTMVAPETETALAPAAGGTTSIPAGEKPAASTGTVADGASNAGGGLIGGAIPFKDVLGGSPAASGGDTDRLAHFQALLAAHQAANAAPAPAPVPQAPASSLPAPLARVVNAPPQ